MKKLLPAILLLSAKMLMAQTDPTIINITAKGNANANAVTIDKKIKISLTPGAEYQLKISGLNSAHTSLKVQAKAKEIYTAIPDLLKPVLPGVTGSYNRDIEWLNSHPEDLLSTIQKKVKVLRVIKQKADSLHAATLFQPDTAKARIAYNAIKDLYTNTSINLPDLVANDIQFLLTANDMADVFIKNSPSLDFDTIGLYANLTIIGNELKKTDYMAYFDYVKKSMAAKTTLSSKTFTASKDLVELTIILVDSYTKDTLTNETRTLYTAGGNSWGLSFSTGFFYSEKLSDQPYFLQARPDEKVAVIPDRRMISDVSIGGLAHLYYKASAFVRVGPSLGLSVSPFDGKSRYLLGGSLLLGKEKLVGLTFGKAWAKVKELSGAVNTDAQGMYLPKGATAIPTYDRIRNTWFAGITYNLISTRK